jgi:hypothetical protein
MQQGGCAGVQRRVFNNRAMGRDHLAARPSGPVHSACKHKHVDLQHIQCTSKHTCMCLSGLALSCTQHNGRRRLAGAVRTEALDVSTVQ